MRRSVWLLLSLGLTGVLACGRRDRSASPLAALGGLTRAEVSVWPPSGVGPAQVTVRDSATLARLRALAAAPGAWAPIEFATEPNGDVRAALYRNSTYLGVVSLGDGWVGARGPTGGTLYRSMAPAERPVRAALRAAAR